MIPLFVGPPCQRVKGHHSRDAGPNRPFGAPRQHNPDPGAAGKAETRDVACRTFLIGSVAPETQRLVSVTKQALDKAVAACAPGVAFQQLGRVIEPFVREQGFAVNKDFIGHGVGRHFHALPWVMPWKNRERMGKMQARSHAARACGVLVCLCLGGPTHGSARGVRLTWHLTR